MAKLYKPTRKNRRMAKEMIEQLAEQMWTGDLVGYISIEQTLQEPYDKTAPFRTSVTWTQFRKEDHE